MLAPEKILVTAPYNVQVNRLQQRLGNKASVGTVDKFQGQEAPVAIHSLTASDGDAAPRGLAFCLSPTGSTWRLVAPNVYQSWWVHPASPRALQARFRKQSRSIGSAA